jgi:ABC-type multidrug transport system fused ATPase/permease subunit
VFESGFHRLALFFGLASVAVWTYVFNEWWGGEWWGLLLAIVAAIPVGLVFSILPSVLRRTLRHLPLVNDALLTWLFILAGLALGVYALIAFDGTTLAMVVLLGAEIFGAGISER